MNQFYVSIIFFGILLIVSASVWIAYDWKKSKDEKRLLEDKKGELVKIIEDAEQMIEEMNKFSDYIVNQMELKNEELNCKLRDVEAKINSMNENLDNVSVKKVELVDKAVGAENIDTQAKAMTTQFNFHSDLIIENINALNTGTSQSQKLSSKNKVIPINSKHKEVILLAEKGMNDTEIAKKLNIGKGEIQLILGVNR